MELIATFLVRKNNNIQMFVAFPTYSHIHIYVKKDFKNKNQI